MKDVKPVRAHRADRLMARLAAAAISAMGLLWRFNTGDAGCPHKADTVFLALAAAAISFDWQQRMEREKPVRSQQSIPAFRAASGFGAFPDRLPACVPRTAPCWRAALS
ncbi:hypothetical protein [Paenibacillus chitinolyticus]|uniref:hypothetical protein n=1 Tax=Paenibacillus chitinolyticus TaxID=79263 RepID=UPI00295E72A5|nr:hypothetical protein [Paenibacillus chitinolyticus]